MLSPSPSPHPTTLDDLLGPELMSQLDRLDILSRKIFAGKLPGERRSKKRGASVEFDDYRQYVPGDDLRHIDWNVFARMDRFFLKLFREEEDLALHLVIDASPSMDAGSPSKLLFSQRLAMALGYIGLVNGNRVLATIIGAPGRPNVQQLAPIRGRRSTPRLAEFLLHHPYPPSGASPDRPPAPSFVAALRQIALTRRGRGVMVLLTDFLFPEDYRAGLNYLAGGQRGGGFDLYCIQVLSPGELEPEKEPGGGVIGDLRLTDSETGKAAEVTISGALLKRYKQRIADHIAHIRAACAARDAAHILARSDAPIRSLLLDDLRRRGLLG